MLILELAVCPLLDVLTYFSIKFGSSIGIEKKNVFDSKFGNFDAFCQCAAQKR